MSSYLSALEARLREKSDLESAAAVLRWDEATFMPSGGATARGRQLGLLDQLVHDRITDPEIGRLLDRLESSAGAHESAALPVSVKAVVAFCRFPMRSRATARLRWSPDLVSG